MNILNIYPMSMLKTVKSYFIELFTKTKKVVPINQGKEFESWLGI
jgi:hypothetical protein